MSKPRRAHGRGKRVQPAFVPGPEYWRDRIETLLAGGKSRDAVEAAKQYLKNHPGPEAEALAQQAYLARIAALQGSGLHREAQAIGALVQERFPAVRAQVGLLMQQSDVATGNVTGLLSALLSAEPTQRRALEAILARGLHDPALLASAPVLPPEHPLKRTAATVLELLTAVTSGALPEGALAALDAIARQSPLAPWKLLIRALDAFYRRDDASVLANLAAIPADTPPARLVPVLRALVGAAELPAERSVDVSALLSQVAGPRALIQLHLTQLEQALLARDERKALGAVQALLPLLQTASAGVRRTFIVSLLHHWHRQNFPPQPLLRLLPSSKRDPDILRLLALTLERTIWDEGLEFWHNYLREATAAGLIPPTGPERARILLHMASLFPADPDTLFDMLGIASEQELRQDIRAGDLPACFDRAGLLEQARAADPSSRAFRALVEHYERWGDPKRAEAEAEAWHRAHPQDLEPLLHLMRVTERRGAVRKALSFLAEAEAIDRVHPEVRQSRFRLLLAGAERRLKEGKSVLALDDLERLAQEPRASEGDHRAYLLALTLLAAQQRGDAAAAAHYEQQLHTATANPVLQQVLLESLSSALKLPVPPSPAGTPTPAQVLDGVVRACDLFRALDRPVHLAASLYKQLEQALPQATAAQLHALCAGGLWMQRPALTYRAAGQGLALSDPLLYRFVLARGRALGLCPGMETQERARVCLRAARDLASRVRDMEAVREATEALAAIPAWGMLDAMFSGRMPSLEEPPLTQEDITQIIQQERQRRTLPRFPASTTPRKRRQSSTPARRRRSKLDELFEALPFKDFF
ncbi:MAG: hypothetical protein AB7N91_24125 [Candidatus Tectimicrobiota bacterium]